MNTNNPWKKKHIVANVKAVLKALRGQKFKKCTGGLCIITTKGSVTIRENCALGVMVEVLADRHPTVIKKIELRKTAQDGVVDVYYDGHGGTLPEEADKAFGIRSGNPIYHMNDGVGGPVRSFKFIANYIERQFNRALQGKDSDVFDAELVNAK